MQILFPIHPFIHQAIHSSIHPSIEFQQCLCKKEKKRKSYLFPFDFPLGLTRVRTDTSPFPPRVSPSLKLLGCLFMASLLFCWYSSSMVMAATPFAMAPVILEAAPARPPGGRRLRTCQYPTCDAAAIVHHKGAKSVAHGRNLLEPMRCLK